MQMISIVIVANAALQEELQLKNTADATMVSLLFILQFFVSEYSNDQYNDNSISIIILL